MKKIIVITMIGMMIGIIGFALMMGTVAKIGKAEKYSPYDDVKWGFEKIDPVWEGIPKVTYTPSSETSCKNGKCNLILYSGVRRVYEDNKWKKIEDARSLKGYFDIVYLKKDDRYDLEIVDFNYTSVILKPTVKKIPDLNRNIPIKIDDVNKSFVNYKSVLDKQEIILYSENTLSKNYTFGEHSTTIILQDANSENLKDAPVLSGFPDTNFGTLADLYAGYTGETSDQRSYITFNLSSIPAEASIISSTLEVHKSTTLLDADNVSVHQVYNDWMNETGSVLNESQLTWNNQPCGTGFTNFTNCNLTMEDIVYAGTADAIWMRFNVTNSVNTSFIGNQNNVSLVLEGRVFGEVYSVQTVMDSKETATASLRPYLNITYTAPDITPPTISVVSPLNQTYATNTVIIPFNVSLDEDGSYCSYSLNGNTNVSMTRETNKKYFNLTVSGFTAGDYYVQFYCNDTSNNWNMTGTKKYFHIFDVPMYSQNSTNSTQAGEIITHSLKWDDANGLSGYIFSFCNDSYKTSTGTPKQNFSMLSDGFETNDMWTRTASGYGRDAAQKTSGTYSYRLNASKADKFFWNKIANDTSTCTRLIVQFMNRDDDLETNDIQLYFNSSDTTWDSMVSLGGGTEDAWNVYTATTTDTQYFHKDFAIRIGGTTETGENHWVDDLNITCENSTTIVKDCSDSDAILQNYSWTSMVGVSNQSNISILVTSTADKTVKWCVMANDTDDKWNTTGCKTPFSYNTTITDILPPIVTILSPTNSTYSSASMPMLIPFNVSLNEAGSTCLLELDKTANITMTKQSNNLNFNWTNLTDVGSHNARFYCNDTANNMNLSGWNNVTFNVIDNSSPTYSNIGVSNTNPSILDNVIFYSDWNDDTATDSFIFGWNATGLGCDTWANDTSVKFTNKSANITKQIPAVCLGKISGIGWRVYANDTSNNGNSTNITLSFSAPPADTCTAPSINNNWNVLWRDNCTVSSNTDLGTGALNLYGAVTGSFTLNADLYCSNLWSTQPTTGFGRIINFQRLKIR